MKNCIQNSEDQLKKRRLQYSISRRYEKNKKGEFQWFKWYEYANPEGNIKRDQRMETGWFCFKEVGGIFIIQMIDYLIGPGVSTREELLEFLQKIFVNFQESKKNLQKMLRWYINNIKNHINDNIIDMIYKNVL